MRSCINIMQKGKNIFEQYPNLEEYFETCDGQKFFKEAAAKTHARTLEDKEVKKVLKKDFKVVSKPKTFDIKKAGLEELKALLEKEKSEKKPNAKEIEALEKRITELENSQKDETEN